jgi:hypothetical protein
MKFLKFVLDYDSESNAEVWQSHADEPLTTFLASQFHLDTELQAYVLTLTLSFDRQVGTRDGLAAINRHLTSMGVFGPGFAAVYPKWGGLSEVAQVACRAGAVGGGIYMLGTGIEKAVDQSENGEPVEVVLSSGTTIKTHLLVRGAENQPAAGAEETSRLVAVVSSPLRSLFEVLVEGAPAPAVAVIAFPPGSVTTKDGNASEQPIYVYAHSSDTGECPVGQSKLPLQPYHFVASPTECHDDPNLEYLSTLSEPLRLDDTTSDILIALIHLFFVLLPSLPLESAANKNTQVSYTLLPHQARQPRLSWAQLWNLYWRLSSHLSVSISCTISNPAARRPFRPMGRLSNFLPRPSA